METQDIIIVMLMFTCAGLCIWLLILDSKYHHMKGFVRRAEFEMDQLQKQLTDLYEELYECENNPDFGGHSLVAELERRDRR